MSLRRIEPAALYLGAAVTLAFLLFQQGQVTVSDGTDMLAVAHSILHHGTFAVNPQVGVLGHGGHYYAKYGLGLSIVVLPFIAVADVLSLAIGHQANLESFMASSAMPVIMGLLAMVLWRVTRRLGGSPRWSAVVAVGALLGTYALPYGKDFFSEPLVALAIVLSFDQILSRRPFVAGLALALAIITRPEAAVLLLFFPLIVAAASGLRAGVLYAAAGSLGALIDAGYNAVRFGSVFNSGYGGESFSTPFLHGAGGLLGSPEKSLLLFAPIVLLVGPAAARLWRSHRWMVVLALSNLLAFFVMAALWHSWEGGWSWGPRLVVPGVIAILPLLARASSTQRRVAVALFVLGFAVSGATLLVPTEAQQLDRPVSRVGPAVVRQYELISSVASYSAHHLQAVHTPGAHDRYLSLWQVNLGREFGTKGLLVSLLASVGMAAALIAIVARTAVLRPRRVPWPYRAVEAAQPTL